MTSENQLYELHLIKQHVIYNIDGECLASNGTRVYELGCFNNRKYMVSRYYIILDRLTVYRIQVCIDFVLASQLCK